MFVRAADVELSLHSQFFVFAQAVGGLYQELAEVLTSVSFIYAKCKLVQTTQLLDDYSLTGLRGNCSVAFAFVLCGICVTSSDVLLATFGSS